MISLQNIYETLAELKERLNLKLSHPYLARFLSSPVVDEDKLLLFYAILDEAPVTEEEKKNYTVTAMLVQIALDTHDNVTTSGNVERGQFFKRQLTVLAGDYYSGLYYSLLAEMNDVMMVRTLATAIKEINEHKIRLYESADLDMEEAVKSMLVIETALCQHLSDHFGIDLWKAVSKKFLSFKRLSAEKAKMAAGSSQMVKGFSSGKITFQEMDAVKSDLVKRCNFYFDEAVSLVERSLESSNTLKHALLGRLENIKFHEDSLSGKLAEEGF
ncbi:heptaprenyl diphosphate synthase component 1 [Bacillus sp. FJAT-42376]|uniref:heptaprenyl diphosphate synthase component 1 n=1 Tax=Bacillus sp. FJAT-42376 TaxID=2014076 RepID=UPI000F4EECFA|nr:heptaprenyl diphosphate synthase component 1 [Bacillus sp. FJAT-42376]AZB43341.1 heptaprenyl diphosphate synthase component 1 [Bacillus sp. FJAT-42376]